jgi:decaprenylphospho-beta-D-erythro-pentofuranosid-2-ulose 2-reductase
VKDALGAVQSALVLGGTSEIAVATVRRLAQDRLRRVVLGVRDPEAAAQLAEALRSEGLDEVHVIAFDARDTGEHPVVVARAAELIGDLDLVLLAFGVLGDQDELDADPAAGADLVAVNLGGSVSAGLAAAARLREQGHGTLAVLSSVAGERVRAENLVYGATKAGLDGFAQGLGDALVGTGARVMVVRPGFVHTKMTEGRDPAPFATTPDAVADEVAKGLARGAHTVWAPPVLRFVFSGLRHLPRPLWRRVSAR